MRTTYGGSSVKSTGSFPLQMEQARLPFVAIQRAMQRLCTAVRLQGKTAREKPTARHVDSKSDNDNRQQCLLQCRHVRVMLDSPDAG